VRQGDIASRVLIDGDEARLPVGDGPIVVNAGGHGFYRVAYSDELRTRITDSGFAGMSTLERYNLVDDAWNAVTAGAMDAMEWVALAERFVDEREYGVWQSIAIGLRAVRRLIGDDDVALARYQARVRALVAPALTELGEPVAGETDLTAKVRGLLLGLMAIQGGDDAARRRGRDYYAAWEVDRSAVDAELAAASAAIVANIGDSDDYERMLNQYRTGDTPQVQLRHLYLLAEFDDPDLMARTCALAMSDEVKTQNAPFLLRACIGNRRHGPQAWEFVRRNWSGINERFPRNTIVRLIENVKSLDRPTDVADVQAFFAEHPIVQAAKTLEQTLERQRVNADVRARNEDAVRYAFATQV
jgi:puromycin-sensitive aminopeptidase